MATTDTIHSNSLTVKRLWLWNVFHCRGASFSI